MLHCCDEADQESKRFLLLGDLGAQLEHLEVAHLSESDIEFVPLYTLNDLSLVMTTGQVQLD